MADEAGALQLHDVVRDASENYVFTHHSATSFDCVDVQRNGTLVVVATMAAGIFVLDRAGQSGPRCSATEQPLPIEPQKQRQKKAPPLVHLSKSSTVGRRAKPTREPTEECKASWDIPTMFTSEPNLPDAEEMVDLKI